MNAGENPPLPKLGSIVVTACRGQIQYDASIPSIVYRGRRVYFCLPSCLKSFLDDPKTSCLAGDPLMADDV